MFINKDNKQIDLLNESTFFVKKKNDPENNGKYFDNYSNCELFGLINSDISAKTPIILKKNNINQKCNINEKINKDEEKDNDLSVFFIDDKMSIFSDTTDDNDNEKIEDKKEREENNEDNDLFHKGDNKYSLFGNTTSMSLFGDIINPANNNSNNLFVPQNSIFANLYYNDNPFSLIGNNYPIANSLFGNNNKANYIGNELPVDPCISNNYSIFGN